MSGPPTPAAHGMGEYRRILGENRRYVEAFDRSALSARAREGKLRAETLVWREGMVSWMAVSQVPELADIT